MRWGTSHFVSRRAAVRYYASPYSATTDEAERVVTRKLADGEIHIGAPTLKPGQRLSIIHGEGRYQVEDDA
jgi:hypothetical protein